MRSISKRLGWFLLAAVVVATVSGLVGNEVRWACGAGEASGGVVIRTACVVGTGSILLAYFLYRFANPHGQSRKTGFDAEKFSEVVEDRVRRRTAELMLEKEDLQEEVDRQPLMERRFHEQIRHLECLYKLSRLVESPRLALEQIFEQSLDIIRQAYRCPEKTSIRITFDGVPYETEGFKRSELSQYGELVVDGEAVGGIEIYIPVEMRTGEDAAFSKGEWDVLAAVTERLERVAELKRATNRLEVLRNLIDRSHDSAFVLEPQWGRLVEVNETMCDVLGYRRNELLLMPIRQIDESICNDAVWEDLRERIRTCGGVIAEGLHRRRDGGSFPVETSLRWVSGEHDNYVIGLSRDITERKDAENRRAELIEQLKSTNERIESMNQELKDFAHIVSHDLKAPLAGIKAMAGWIMSDYGDKLGDEGTEQMKELVEQVQRMHKLIEGVLEYSKAGRACEADSLEDLNEAVADAIAMVRAPDNVSIEVESRLPEVVCDPTRLMQVFQNLISNAVKYMDKPDGRVRISCAEDGDFWRFCVADNGPGIEPKHFDRIFKIFAKLGCRDDFESTGVGLAVVKRIVELYGGRIWVESEPGIGSRFYFTIAKSRCGHANEKAEAAGAV